MYEGKQYSLEKNLTHFFEKFAYIFLPLEIKVSFLKPQKCIFFQLIARNGTYENTFSVKSLDPYTDSLSCLLQLQHRQSYLCSFSPFSLYSSEDYFQVLNYQLLLFIYVKKTQLQVTANNFILILYQSKYIFLLFSCYFSTVYPAINALPLLNASPKIRKSL